MMENKELRSKVESLVLEVEKTHRYSMSRTYGIHNEVFGKNEQPQSCASCLIRKVQELKKWLTQQPNTEETKQAVSKPRKRTAKKSNSDNRE